MADAFFDTTADVGSEEEEEEEEFGEGKPRQKDANGDAEMQDSSEEEEEDDDERLREVSHLSLARRVSVTDGAIGGRRLCRR
jgi:transcription elongation factor SPT6